MTNDYKDEDNNTVDNNKIFIFILIIQNVS